MKIYLASESPRRRHMLSWFKVDFEVIDHGVDESEYEKLEPKEMVGCLALDKALGGAEQVMSLSVTEDSRHEAPEEVVIGSDLTVELDEEMLGKPKDIKQAKEYLRKLSGKTHNVWCGVAVVSRSVTEDSRREAPEEKALMSVARSQVTMKNYDEKVIDEYVSKFEVLDKGGAYSILFELPNYGKLVEKFEGGMSTILGLPMEHLENLLKEVKVKVSDSWREICKQETGYEE